MAAEFVELSRLPVVLGHLSQCDNELESLTDLAAGLDLQGWNRLLQTIREDYLLLEQFNEALETLLGPDINPCRLTDLQLEQRINVIAKVDDFVRGSLVDTLEDLVASSEKMVLMAKGLSLLAMSSDSGSVQQFRQRAKQSLETRERTLKLARRWQDELVTLKYLGELSRRRPLTKEEKILMTNASVIYTPVVQDPSDRREDWYD